MQMLVLVSQFERLFQLSAPLRLGGGASKCFELAAYGEQLLSFATQTPNNLVVMLKDI